MKSYTPAPKKIYTNIYGNFVHSSQNLETIQLSFDDKRLTNLLSIYSMEQYLSI